MILQVIRIALPLLQLAQVKIHLGDIHPEDGGGDDLPINEFHAVVVLRLCLNVHVVG